MRSPKLASIGVPPNSVTAGLNGLIGGDVGRPALFCTPGSSSYDLNPVLPALPGPRSDSVSREAGVNGRFGIWLARCETRANQEPLDCCGEGCASRP